MESNEMKHIDKRFDELQDVVDQIKRGLYGDKANNVPGLIAVHAETKADHHRRISKVEKSVMKFLWFGGGAMMAIEIVWILFKELSK